MVVGKEKSSLDLSKAVLDNQEEKLLTRLVVDWQDVYAFGRGMLLLACLSVRFTTYIVVACRRPFERPKKPQNLVPSLTLILTSI